MEEILDAPVGSHPDPDAFVRAAMRWHFDPRTGSPFWLSRAGTLGFDPIGEVRTFDDLALFPNVVNELREVRAEDLVPAGLSGVGAGPAGAGPAGMASVCESGGTTGAPKRVLITREWSNRV